MVESDSEEEEVALPMTKKAKKLKKSTYKETIEKRGVMCEKMVDLESLGKKYTVHAIIDSNLGFFFKPIEGYFFPLCHEFYLDLSVMDGDLMVLRIKVQGKVIDITPISIVKYLSNKRPNSSKIDYPHVNFAAKDPYEYVKEM